MNAMTKLLNLLDKIYGFEDQSKSVLRKTGHRYDEKNNVYITNLEYRVRRKNGGVVNKPIKENSLLRNLLKRN